MNLPTIIIRHQRENLKKCSLRGLEKHLLLRFFTYPKDSFPDLSSYIVLAVDAIPLSEEDIQCGLLLLDGTWRLTSIMQRQCPPVSTRSLPSQYKTAYPRRQTGCSHPSQGLASVEALYLAHKILNRPTEGLLDNYHWKDDFLHLNATIETTIP